MKIIHRLIACLLMGFVPLGAVALIVLFFKGMFLETIVLTTASAILGGLIFALTDK